MSFNQLMNKSEMKKIIIGSERKGIWGSKVINYIIRKIHPDIIIEYKNIKNCDFIIEGIYWDEKTLWNTDKKKYLYWSGEPGLPFKSNYDSGKNLFIGPVIFGYNLYVPYFLYSPYLYKKRKYINNYRPYLIAYCSSHKINRREKLFNILVDTSSIHKCHSLGKCYGKYPETQRKVSGHWSDGGLIDAYSEYKFVFAVENCQRAGYITEKILNAFYSGAIPIYWGSENINSFFNKKAFINVNDFKNFKDCAEYIANLTEEKIKIMVSEPIYNNKSPEKDLLNLINDKYNMNHNNTTLCKYISRFEKFLED